MIQFDSVSRTDSASQNRRSDSEFNRCIGSQVYPAPSDLRFSVIVRCYSGLLWCYIIKHLICILAVFRLDDVNAAHTNVQKIHSVVNRFDRFITKNWFKKRFIHESDIIAWMHFVTVFTVKATVLLEHDQFLLYVKNSLPLSLSLLSSARFRSVNLANPLIGRAGQPQLGFATVGTVE